MKRISEKDFRLEKLVELVMMLIIVVVTWREFFVFSTCYVRVTLLGLGIMGSVYSYIDCRCLIDKGYFKRCLIARNDERYQDILVKSGNISFQIMLFVLTVLLALALGWDSEPGRTLVLELKQIIILLFAVAVTSYMGAMLVYKKTL